MMPGAKARKVVALFIYCMVFAQGSEKIAYILAIVLIPTVIFGNPIPRYEEWRSPCGEQVRPDFPDLDVFASVRQPSLQESLREIVISLREMRTMAKNLKSNYSSSRVRLDDCIKNLEADFIRLDGFPRSRPFRGELRLIRTMNVSDIMLRDYYKLSVVMIFVEQMRWDEEAYENNEFSRELADIFAKIKTVLCQFWNRMKTDGFTVEDFPNRTDAMKEEYRTLSRADNYDRDYVVMKETDKLLANMILKYTALRDFLNNN